jgi:heme/copper-type cytochrome/quinol oxidase subunit 2
MLFGELRLSEWFSILQHFDGAKGRLILVNLLLALAVLAPEYTKSCSTDGEMEPTGSVFVSDSGAAAIALPCRIELIGEGHRWQAQYQSAGGRWVMPGNRDNNEPIHVPLGVPTVISLKSKDFVYLFVVARLGLREIAVPDLEFCIEFRPLESGSFLIASQRLCEESAAAGELVVEPAAKFRAWLRKIE